MATVTISTTPAASYPASTNLSPTTPFPEYPFGGDARGSNELYGLVRRCLHEAGADADRYGTSSWNPLGQWIQPGDRVLVLPNFVTNRRSSESPECFRAKCTHASIIRPVFDYAAIASGSPEFVSFGNAPLQSADYGALAAEVGATEIRSFFAQRGHEHVGPHDLRLLVGRWTSFGALLDTTVGDPRDAIEVDLGEHSLLEVLFHNGVYPRVRVGDYPPEVTEAYHARGRHVYVINRRVLEASVIISVPKLKTHQKVGITCALKGTVGTIARKECLAHHRQGGPENGGDEYPHATVLRDYVSGLADRTAGMGTGVWPNVSRVTSKVLGRALRTGPKGVMGGAWSGNDTAWRMTLDIARILRYARVDGSLSTTPVRQHIALVDGVVAGEGDGPLRPTPRPLGVVLFGADVCAVDAACALVMGYDPGRVPLVRNSFSRMAFGLTTETLLDLTVSVDDKSVSPDDLGYRFEPAFATSKGWHGAIELSQHTDSQWRTSAAQR